MAEKRNYSIGFDVGSTTVKAVVIDTEKDEIIWSDYQRHDTKQPEKSLELLKAMERDLDLEGVTGMRCFITGSGGGNIGKHIGGKFVQEVNAVSLAVEKLYPATHSVIELGGQDAKIIIFKPDEETGKKKKIPSMNDKCAGGTGAVIDKINAKLKIPAAELSNMGYNDLRLHPVAGKCGVFAETDINGLQKSGVPSDQLMASLFESIIQQNISVLTRGHTLMPEVLLLGGPNCYIKGMKDCWKYNIPKIWEERKVILPQGVAPEDLIKVPDNAQYFAAIGAVEYGKEEEDHIGVYTGWKDLEHYILVGREEEKKKMNGGNTTGLYATDNELAAFKEKHKIEKFIPATFKPGEVVRGCIGIDGGSTSTKAALVSLDKEVLIKAYQLSKGNPIEDTIDILGNIQKQVEDQGATLEILGVGTTGYAKDILKDVLQADVALVETVAHTQAGLHFYPETDVICDVGGQDIKIIILNQGRVVDFKLNTQCSAGNGYFLQSTAQGFGYTVEEFADKAFEAKTFPKFGYGCAVFMQSDIVDFQRQGWRAEEIMAGLANVLPKNIWLYVSQIPNLAKLGSTFVLQGGTQHNLAAVKTQVDFIEERFKGSGIEPKVFVHKHTGEAGAIGCGIEAARLYNNGKRTEFIGMERVSNILYKTTREESTRCYFCKNKCLRTFIDVKTENIAPDKIEEEKKKFIELTVIEPEQIANPKSKVPMANGTQRLIIATCEKGTVEDVTDMRGIKQGIDDIKKSNPNIIEEAAKNAWISYKPEIVAEPVSEPKGIFISKKQKDEYSDRLAKFELRSKLVIGIPRILNMYQHTPFFTAYFESLGVKPGNFVYSEFTTEEMYKAGAKRGSIDPCFPSKVAIPHIHNLLYVQNKKKQIDFIFSPIVDNMPSELEFAQAHTACPTITATVEAAKAAFIKEGDLFEQFQTEYVNPFIQLFNMQMTARQMFECFENRLGLTEEENMNAVKEGYIAYNKFINNHKEKSHEVLQRLEKEDKIGIVVLARPYHNDPGINHEILEEFQKLGYPVFYQDTLPTDEETLDKLFGDEIKAGIIRTAFDIEDVWKNSYSENTSRKVWAAKYTARHPNLIALELSSFKCGHDAPIYTVIQEIVEDSGTPYFSFKDIDENKPTGSIKIRVETIGYFLKRYREDIVMKKEKEKSIEENLKEFEMKIRKNLELQEKLNVMKKADPSIDRKNGSPTLVTVEEIKILESVE
ncbi:MAG TPA: BadF/BadG/BcrA/BcrD ATPase family protein [Ignavibacteria bacterium]|nr:BadF/BadG/BcrA/BcrD ATPase family protein [Ignavibacteria bacterium]HQY53044.1 BadF/BadG/BcrA/BcrD ATPase family protein [Ignavibacteria bacterium]HRB01174.1 BadF/BadG/BcrA/BcrD ATPase family protein [Ignavibacteria bacterium]